MKWQSDQILLMNGTIACRMEKKEAADKPMSCAWFRVVQLKFQAFVEGMTYTLFCNNLNNLLNFYLTCPLISLVSFGRSGQSGNSPLEMSTSRRNNASDGVFAAAADFTADFAVVINESTSLGSAGTNFDSFILGFRGRRRRRRQSQQRGTERGAGKGKHHRDGSTVLSLCRVSTEKYGQYWYCPLSLWHCLFIR